MRDAQNSVASSTAIHASHLTKRVAQEPWARGVPRRGAWSDGSRTVLGEYSYGKTNHRESICLFTREEAKIDLVGVDEGRTVLVGECKWRIEGLDRDVTETLEHRSGLVHARAGSWLYAFSKSGFTRGAVEAAASHGHMRLVAFGEMCGPNR